ncbi:hypothetical protein RDABS01_022126 [Bienertia sinuspersici]
MRGTMTPLPLMGVVIFV